MAESRPPSHIREGAGTIHAANVAAPLAQFGQLPPSTQMGLPFVAEAQQVVESTSALHTTLHGQVLQVKAGAYLRHSPSAQTSSRAQALPQSPQLSGSLSVFTHAMRPPPEPHCCKVSPHPPAAAKQAPV